MNNLRRDSHVSSVSGYATDVTSEVGKQRFCRTKGLKKMMKKLHRFTLFVFALLAFISVSVCSWAADLSAGTQDELAYELSEEVLIDKLRGSWAGQMAGVAWGAPVEFKALGRMLTEQELPDWSPESINESFAQDDLYVEIPFMLTMKEKGVYCDIVELGEALKNTDFPLWHANYYARKNLAEGISAPDSGHYENNPHCDDIDWMIEADFIGQMCPGLVNEAIDLAFKAGHVTNYGDGVYGGVFVAAMHAKAYIAGSLDEVIEAGRLSVPEGSLFRQLLEDVFLWVDEGNPLEQTWQLLQQKWGYSDRCPEVIGSTNETNIDAKLNAGYVLMALLYGEGDFEESMKIALLCGQDNDCTASTVGSILGNYYGFSGIPAKWVSMLDTDGILFSNTDCTFDAAVELNYLLAESVMSKNGIDTEKEVYIIPREESVIPPVLEQWPKEAPPAVENNIAPEGTPIVSVESPSGNGSRDIGVINDGIMPDVHSSNSFEMFQMQYDTYTGSAADVGYAGYVFENERCFDKIVFQEGMHFADGGWFSDGITVQIRRNGVWEDIAAEVTPVYPVSNDQAEFGSPLEYFLFTFEPVRGDGIRIAGTPGGAKTFFSVAELMVNEPSDESGDSSDPVAEKTVSDESGAGSGTKNGAVTALWVVLVLVVLSGAVTFLLKKRK